MALEDHRFLKGKRGQIAGAKLLQDDDRRLKPSTNYKQVTGIVKDVISNPYEYLRRKYGETEHTVQDILTGRVKPERGDPPKPVDFSSEIKNPYAIDVMPMNSIFAYIVDDGLGKDKGEFVVCYPFFPPHLSLPLKTGEYVWITVEKIGRLKYYYWMCRKVSHRQIDDVNYTNFERIPEINRLLLASRDSNQIDFPTQDSYSVKNARRKFRNSPESAGTNSPISYHSMFVDSYSHVNEFTGEPVPRLSKNCGDLLLQGSNNSGIHLTTEKFAEGDTSIHSSFSLDGDTTLNRKASSSAIDLFVGRKRDSLRGNRLVSRLELSDKKRSSESKLNYAANNANNAIFEHVETDKIAEIRLNDMEVYDHEIKDDDTDATDVAARLYLSRNSEPDVSFGSLFSDLKPRIGESIVTYAENNRVIGESDTRIVSKIGESYISLEEDGKIVIKSSKGGSNQSLTLDSFGNAILHAVAGVQISQGVDTSETPLLKMSDKNTVITTPNQGGIIAKSQNVLPVEAAGPLLITKPIYDFIELPGSARTSIYGTLFGPAAAAVGPVIETAIQSGLVEKALDQLSTKYFFAE